MRFLCAFVIAILPAAGAPGDRYAAQIEPELPALTHLYQDLHAHPELSFHEERTSEILAEELRRAGYAVTMNVGKRPDGVAAYGVVGILRNGAGPMVLVRTELDALPVEEKTGLPYASHIQTKDDGGQTVGVMHACGHDLHMACLVGTART